MSVTLKVRTVLARESGFPVAAEEADTGGGESSGLKRNIPKTFNFDPKAMKPLARMLLSTSIALGHTLTAYKDFTRVKSASISPDGMIGGRGYVLQVRDVRAKLQEACELLSSVSDTIHDEMNASHWKPKLSDLNKNEAEDVTEFLDEANQILDDPERFGDKGLDEVEKRNDGPNGTPDTPQKEQASELPNAGPAEAQIDKPTAKQARVANSTLPVNTLPGPRVDHLDRGEQLGPFGSYNKDESSSDDWGQGGKEYLYPSPWQNNLQNKGASWGALPEGDKTAAWGSDPVAESAVPETKYDDPDTDANDFGLGYGANGGGIRNLTPGPASGLPDSPQTPQDGTAYMDMGDRDLWAATAVSELPFDGPDAVARSDYYQGDRGNQFNTSIAQGDLTGCGCKPTSESRLPEDPATTNKIDIDLPGAGYTSERQDMSYVKYDSTTHDDMQDLYNYDRTGGHG